MKTYPTWPNFYMEFANTLLKYKNTRKELIEKIKRVYYTNNISANTRKRQKHNRHRSIHSIWTIQQTNQLTEQNSYNWRTSQRILNICKNSRLVWRNSFLKQSQCGILQIYRWEREVGHTKSLECIWSSSWICRYSFRKEQRRIYKLLQYCIKTKGN